MNQHSIGFQLLPGKDAYVQTVVEGTFRFTVKVGTPPEGAKNGTKLALAGRTFFVCCQFAD